MGAWGRPRVLISTSTSARPSPGPQQGLSMVLSPLQPLSRDRTGLCCICPRGWSINPAYRLSQNQRHLLDTWAQRVMSVPLGQTRGPGRLPGAVGDPASSPKHSSSGARKSPAAETVVPSGQHSPTLGLCVHARHGKSRRPGPPLASQSGGVAALHHLPPPRAPILPSSPLSLPSKALQ